MAEEQNNQDPAAKTQKIDMDQVWAEADERSMDRIERVLDQAIAAQNPPSNERMTLTDEQLDV